MRDLRLAPTAAQQIASRLWGSHGSGRGVGVKTGGGARGRWPSPEAEGERSEAPGSDLCALHVRSPGAWSCPPIVEQY